MNLFEEQVVEWLNRLAKERMCGKEQEQYGEKDFRNGGIDGKIGI